MGYGMAFSDLHTPSDEWVIQAAFQSSLAAFNCGNAQAPRGDARHPFISIQYPSGVM